VVLEVSWQVSDPLGETIAFLDQLRAVTAGEDDFQVGFEPTKDFGRFGSGRSLGHYQVGEKQVGLTRMLDVQHTISWNTNYSDYTIKTAGAYGFSTAQIGLFNKLYTAHYADSHSSSDKAAAFQIAVWEITYDGNSALNLGANTFKLGSGGSSNAQTIATGWLNTLGTAQQGQWQFKVLDSETRQDQLIAMPVPEPTELAMLLAGLGLIGSVARRKARAASAA